MSRGQRNKCGLLTLPAKMVNTICIFRRNVLTEFFRLVLRLAILLPDRLFRSRKQLKAAIQLIQRFLKTRTENFIFILGVFGEDSFRNTETINFLKKMKSLTITNLP